MKLKMFEYCIVLHPTQDELDEGKSTTLVKDVTRLLAKDQPTATMLAIREIPQEHIDKIDRIEVAVRGF